MFKEKKSCFLRKFSIILALLFVPFFIVLKNTNSVNAASLGTSSFDLYYQPLVNDSYRWQNNILYGKTNGIVVGGGVQRYQFTTSSVQAGGNYATLHFETNIVASPYSINGPYNPWVNLANQNILTCSSNPSGVQVVAKNLNYATTEWYDSVDPYFVNNTLTFYGDVTLSNLQMNTNYLFVCAIGSANYSFLGSPANVWFEQNPMSIEWSNDQSIALNQMMVNQNTTIINQSQEYYDYTYEAVDNIEGQTTSEINGATNGVTTNLLGIIQSFITQLGTLQATDCNLSMPFPEFMGGTTVVNICQGRDVLGNTISVISSVALIMFYIPLAFVLIRLIYNEIRSWTNG